MRKNIRLLAGKPLIAYAIETALASKYIDRLIVSTDDEEIAAVARQYGADVPFIRPAELAQDDSPEWLAWRHAISTLEAEPGAPRIDAFVCVPTTAPLRTVEDVDACIEALLNSDADLIIAVTPARRNPYFSMVTVDEAGEARLVIDKRGLHRRQDAPKVYDQTAVAFAVRPGYIFSADEMFEGKVKAVIVSPECAIDLDTELDFKIAECLMTEQMRQRNE